MNSRQVRLEDNARLAFEEFDGYLRPDGRIGIRNHVVVLAAMDSANPTVRRIGNMVPSAVPVTIPAGRGQYGEDGAQTVRTLIGLASNPNVGGCLVVSLEPTSARQIVDAVNNAGVRADYVAIQEVGSPLEAIRIGARKLGELVRRASSMRRTRAHVSDLVMGVECGGSDTTSGLAANPALGVVADWLVARGGTVYLSETAEILGAEHILGSRAASPAVRDALFAIVANVEEEAARRGVDIRGANPVPDNIRGGITTIEEKSLGAILKGGTSELVSVLKYAERAKGKGLHVMDTPAPAVESLTGLVAGGAQVAVFTTGVGNSIGVKLAPVIKVSANQNTVARMAEYIDVDISGVTLGKRTIEQAGSDLGRALLDVLNGTLTRAEIFGEEEIAIGRLGPTI